MTEASDNREREALSILAAQVETARSQTEEAVSALTQRFSAIVDRIDIALRASRSCLSDEDATSEIRRNEGDLREVVEALQAIQRSRNALATEIRGMTAHTAELLQLASQVDSVGFRTNILSLNAAIEAAHAGDWGKGFAVVANEVRELSAQVRETSKLITRRIGAVNEAILKIGKTHDEVSHLDEAAVASAENRINDVLTRFERTSARLRSVAESSSQESAAIKEEVCESIVHLQFQDRTSQILQHAVNSLEKLAHEGAAHLPEMSKTYTTAEQRRIHEGSEPEAVVPQAVTFF